MGVLQEPELFEASANTQERLAGSAGDEHADAGSFI